MGDLKEMLNSAKGALASSNSQLEGLRRKLGAEVPADWNPPDGLGSTAPEDFTRMFREAYAGASDNESRARASADYAAHVSKWLETHKKPADYQRLLELLFQDAVPEAELAKTPEDLRPKLVLEKPSMKTGLAVLATASVVAVPLLLPYLSKKFPSFEPFSSPMKLLTWAGGDGETGAAAAVPPASPSEPPAPKAEKIEYASAPTKPASPAAGAKKASTDEKARPRKAAGFQTTAEGLYKSDLTTELNLITRR